MIANSVGVTVEIKTKDLLEGRYKWKSVVAPLIPARPYYYRTYTHGPFDWEKTWYLWMFYLIFCCIFEYKLFEDKKER
jgi:hypothetical protein